jgi:hypothetical protein
VKAFLATLDPKPDQTLPEGSEAGKQQNTPGHPDQIVSRHESLTLSEGCVIYRDDSPGRKIVRFVALKSIESCCVQTSKRKSLLVAAVALLLVSSAFGLWLSLLPDRGQAPDLSQVLFPILVQLKSRWIPLELFFCGTVSLLVYLIFRQDELVIRTASGDNQIRIPLSDGFKDSIEPFAAEIRIHARNRRTERSVFKTT